MLSPSQLCSVCFTVFVANFTFSQVEGNSFAVLRHNNTILTNESGFSDNTRCNWNCAIIDSTFPEQRNSVLAKSSRLIRLVVEYKKNVTKQCVNQAFNNSSGNATESSIFWLPGSNQLSAHRVIQHWFDLLPCPDTTVHIKAVCRFVRDLGTRSKEVNSTFNNSINMYPFVRSHLKDHGIELRTSTDMESIARHFTTAYIWLRESIAFLVSIFCYAIVYYFLAILCLFSPTLVHENGLYQIIVEGASPVSFRSLVGNYFFSECDSVGHRVGELILRLLVLPFTLIALAVIPLYYPQHQNLSDLLKPLQGVCVACCVISFTYNSFFKTSHQVNTCNCCQLLEQPNLAAYIVHDVEVPRRILTHLRIQPLLLKKSWSFLCTCLIYFFKIPRLILSRRKVSLLLFFRVGGFLVFLFTIPAVTIMFLTAMPVAIFFCAIVTSPAMVLFQDEIASIDKIFYRLPSPLTVLIELAATVGFKCVLSSAALGLVKIVGETLIFLLSEENLPFNTLVALICYYLWNSYSNFTNKYHDLSIMLYKCYQKHRPKEISDETTDVSTTNPVQSESKPIPESNCNEMKIPQQLFDMACEELMPIRESVWKLFLRVFWILSFFFVAFALTSLFTNGVTHVTKSLVTCFTGLCPKIVAIFMIDRDRALKHEAMVTEEKVQCIVQRYITGTASTGKIKTLSFGTNTEELIIHVDNEAGVGENSPI